MKFAGMMRVKNEGRWIGEVIESILPLCDAVYVMDDHSDDDTREIADGFPGVTVLPSPFSNFNESRDKNWLLECVTLNRPDWILCVDGDEVLERRGPDIIRDTVATTECHAYSLKIEYLWNDRQTVRVDRVYGDFWRPSLFRPFYPRPGIPDDLKLLEEFRFMSTPFGRKVDGHEPNFHCSSVPQRLLAGHQRCPARLKHYGYMSRTDRVRKLDFYTSKDWNNAAEDRYRHMVQGDGATLDELPLTKGMLQAGRLSVNDVREMLDVPSDKYLVHAGPIKLVPFQE